MSKQGSPLRYAVAAIVVPWLAAANAAAQEAAAPSRICLAPTSVESASGSATAASDAARETLTAYLTGPSLEAKPLQARLASQVREEARQAGCPYLLLTTLKHEHKRGGGGLLGRAAAGAVQQGAWEAGAASGSIASGTGDRPWRRSCAE